jgi:acid phosphatase (class A)
MQGVEAPYLAPADVPNSVAILPAPPAAGSAQQAGDKATFEATRALKGSPRWGLAQRDAVLTPQALATSFSCAVGVALTPKTVPALFTIMDRAKADVAVGYSRAKDFYQRKRPFVGNDLPICVPRDPFLAANGSYPSGHTTIGETLALVLAAADPERSEQILTRGRVFGESRIVCGVHWSSDVEAGLVTGATVFAALEGSGDFRADLEALRRQIAAAPAGGTQAGECQVETDAATHSVMFKPSGTD